MRQSTPGKNQYHAAILKFEKRVSNGWGGRINYTYSRLEDNQLGETNFFSRNGANAQDAYNLDGGVRPQHPRRAAQGRAVADRRAAVRRGQALAQLGDRQPASSATGRVSSIISFESGFPVTPRTLTNGLASIFAQHAVGQRRAPAIRRPTATARSASTAPGSTPPATPTPAPTRWARCGRVDENTRTPHRNNWDFVATKDVRFGGSVRGQFRLEVLNITDTVKVRGPIETLGSADFGQIRVQSGFMRLTQLMFRLSF